MWPKIEHDSDGYMLAASHAIGRNAVIDEEVATFLAGHPACALPRPACRALRLRRRRAGCRRRHRSRRQTSAAAASRARGGELDLEKAALMLLTDYRTGALGRISLETPETRSRHA